MVKKMGSFILTSTLATLLVSGCASNSTATNSKSGSSSNGVSGTLEIQYFVGGYGNTWWKEVINDFKKKYPNINIKEDAGPKINDQMKPRWIRNDPPDVVYIDGAGASEPQMVQDHQLLDITDWLKTAKADDGTLIKDHFVAQPTQYGGKEYSMPLVFGYNGTFYDEALFKKNGWPAPTDFDTFVSDMDKARAVGMYGYIHQGIYPGYIEGGLFDQAIATQGGLQTLEDFNKMKKGVYLSDPVQKAMQRVQMLRDKGYIDKGALALNHIQSQSEWLQHKAAFIPDGLWLPNEMKDSIPNGFQFGFVPSVMQDKGQKYEVIPYTSTMGVASHAKNPTAAKAFIQFIFQEKYAKDWVKDTGALMNYKVDLTNTDVPDYAKQAESYLLDSSKINLDRTVSSMDPDFQKALDDATTAFMGGKIDAKGWGQRLEKAAEQIKQQKGIN